jgi:hypothetical protein
MKLIVSAASFLLLLAPSSAAWAQPAGRLTVTGTIEHARITDDESFLGSGLGGGGGVQWRLTDATAIELEIGREHHRRDFETFAVALDAQGRPQPLPYTRRWEGTATFVIASVSHTFGSGPVRPVMWGGGGFMSHGGTRRGPVVAPQVPPGLVLQPGDFDSSDGAGSQALAADGGLGVEVRIAPRISVRPFAGLRLVGTENFGPKYIVRAGVRIGFRP